ncbi:mobile mystery protein A [Oxalobacteraceae bacterium]|nr:mobile mystery protein A [Oxalobacteraceae bacterium]
MAEFYRLTQVAARFLEVALSQALLQVQTPPRPDTGWINAIRKALGMTTRQLAERMGVAQSTVVALEQSEADDKINLQSLLRAAEALDCELRYALVPRQSLEAKVEQQAEYVARKAVNRVTHTMRLEAQEPTANYTLKVIEREKDKVLQGRWGTLWES